ncbi:MAG: hypothetical protein G5Z42_00435 [Caldisphaeraceae archaeon]|nr:hypothetical protein [Caldisphaeraceae archaeon]MEB3797271.1 hypothetical protein [Caldisphaeraceae archaeon]
MIRYQFSKTTFAFLILVFTAIITSSLLISGEIMGTYNIYNTIEGLGRKGSIIVTGYSISPYTSLINKQELLSKLKNTSGIKNVAFVVLSLGYVKGRDVAFIGVSNYKDPYCAYPGYYVKEELNLEKGQVILVHPALSGFPIALKVCNFSSKYKWAIMVSLNVAYQMHGGGINRGLASLAIIHLKSPSYKKAVMKYLNIPPLQGSLLKEASLIVQNYKNEEVQKVFRQASRAYFSKLGVPRVAFLSLAVSSAAIISMASYVSGYVFTIVDRDRIEVLRNYGISARRILVNSLLISYASIAASAVMSLLIFEAIKGFASSTLLGLPLTPTINGLTLLPSLVLVFAISSISAFVNLGGYFEQ